MPLKVNEMVIQAKFCGDSESGDADSGSSAVGATGSTSASKDLEVIREDIIRDCMEKVEALLEKRQVR